MSPDACMYCYAEPIAWITSDGERLCEECCLRGLHTPVTTLEKRRDEGDDDMRRERAEGWGR